ncbi:non-ribosomal peptide synthetase/type I polyketide synthase [Aquimarina intermedia]|uniref:Non-ribosomal peptide synthase protein (TIGR01720 family)/amino acid adenylation domain-containing protein n=1 Tax=Aquimarina intermedia TaxID=350814 RepID=A0A5S5C6Y2_9FLAO|nr:non-ribosomal peptide synthetase/type I polyketide synthase [Aquimarina intermedia]TYP74358.1 non-ribosomal peptide synthase protein (TIGR01720 family)/amino acid adenylation domain-containing protein [Aquimarina intermedia]
MSTYTGLEIAIIGLSCRFPDAKTPEAFWENLKSGKDSISSFTKEEAIAEGATAKEIEDPKYVRSSAYLKDKEKFDSSFFDYLPDEAELMDPQTRLFHETCWEALEDSGYANENNAKIGVFAAGSPNPKWMLHASIKNKREELLDEFTASQLGDITFLSTRIAYKLDLTGPALFVQSACSSSLVAVHEACNSLLLGECRVALAGGVNVNNYSQQGYVYKEGMILSQDGKCRPFDAESSGTIVGEGSGVVVLKRLKDALQDNDNIYAIIKGSATNNDGSAKVGYTAPSVRGQIEVIKRALGVSKINPESISYIEAHGTGTQLGDPIEIEALNEVFSGDTREPCVIGAVKSNIGHLDSASGIAGLIKTALALKNRQIPPTLNFRQPNKKVPFDDGPFYVSNQLQDWKQDEPLRAGVSSFGIGGSNAHVVLEESPERIPSSSSRDFQLLLVSAKSKKSFEGNVKNLATYFKEHPQQVIADVAYTLQKGRKRFQYRSSLICENSEQAIEALTSKSIAIHKASLQENIQHVIFMFSGQGSQYFEMSKDLYEKEVFFRDTLDECFEISEKFSNKDFREALFTSGPAVTSDASLINETVYTQPILFSIQYAIAKLLMHWGLIPDYLIGHSIGEYTAACISGVMTLEDTLKLVIKRGELMGKTPKGSMISITATREEIDAIIAGHSMEVDISVINGENSIVVSSSTEEMEYFKQVLDQEEITFANVVTSHGFHSRLMDTILEEFENEVSGIEMHPPQIPYISNVTGELIAFEEVEEPRYWSSHLRNTVLFHQGVSNLLKRGTSCFIEVGPGRILSNIVQNNTLKTDANVVLSTMRHPKQDVNDQKFLISKVGEMWVNGLEIRWDNFYQNEKRHRISLPKYSFNPQTYTTNYRIDHILRMENDKIPDAEVSSNLLNFIYQPTFKKSLYPNKPLSLAQKSIVFFEKESNFDNALINDLKSSGAKVIRIRENSEFKKIAEDLFVLDACDELHLELLWKSILDAEISISDIVYSINDVSEKVSDTKENINNELNKGYLPLCLLGKSIQKNGVKNKIHLSVIASGIAKVTAQDVINPLRSTILSPIKILPSEINNLSARLIDLPQNMGGEEIAEYVSLAINEICYNAITPMVAYRHYNRWTQSFDEFSKSEKIESNVAIDTKKTYLITGAFGGMGLSIASNLVLEKRANIVMVYRSFFPSEDQWESWLKDTTKPDSIKDKIALLKRMKSSGCNVTLMQADVSDIDEVERVASELQKQNTKISGIIWAAGEVDHGGIVLNRDRAEMMKYLGSKLNGLHNFQKYFDFRKLDFLSLFSSMGNVFYQVKFGQVSYNAANEYLDSYAHYIKDTFGIHAFAINWCDWLNVGMTFNIKKQQLSSENLKEINSTIDDAIYPEQGISIFYHCLNSKAVQSAIHKSSMTAALAQHSNYLEATRREVISTDDNSQIQSDTLHLNTIEQRMISLYKTFFGKDAIGLDDDFFDLGGDSLKAMTLASRINKAFDADLSISDIYEYSTLQLLIDNLFLKGSKKHISIPKAEKQTYYPLSSQQKSMYFLQTLNVDSIAYNEPKLYKFKEAPNRKKITKAFEGVLKKHTSLRTIFTVVAGEVVQSVKEELSLDLQIIKNDDVQQAVTSFIRPFKLTESPLFRIGIIESSASEQYLVIDSHHIVTDGTSNGIIIKDFIDLYNGKKLEENRLDYVDYAVHQQSEKQQAAIEKQETYWIGEIDKNYVNLELPIDYKRPLNPDYKGGILSLELDDVVVEQLKSLSLANETTLFTTLLGAFYILLHKISGSEDIIVGVPTSGRRDPEIESIVGMFVGTLALRNYPNGDQSFSEFIQILKKRVTEGFDNQDYPFESLIKNLGLERDAGRTPLFDTMFVFENLGDADVTNCFIENVPLKSNVLSRFDLTLSAVEQSNKLIFNFVYASQLWNRKSVENISNFFSKILSEVSSNPNQKIEAIEILSEKEKDKILFEFNDTLEEINPNKCVINYFNEQAVVHAKKTALIFEDQLFTYEALHHKSNKIAQSIIEKTHKESVRIAMVLSPGLAMVSTILAIQKAGCTYIPLDPNAPDKRNTFIVQDCNVEILITEDTHVSQCEWFEEEILNVSPHVTSTNDDITENVLVKRDTQHIVYIVYTSGTTGNPKGVAIRNESLVNYTLWNIANTKLSYKDNSIVLVPYYFDGFCCNFYSTLLSGGSLVLVSPDDMLNSRSLVSKLLTYNVTNFASLPGLYGAVLDDLEAMEVTTSIKQVILAGERANKKMVERHHQILPEVMLANEYGPTETTVAATRSNEMTGDKLNNIGAPIWNTFTYILDKNHKPLPIGVQGELYISGTCVAQGYVNNKELTEATFIDNPFVEGAKMYRTGDLAKWNKDGSISLLGRADLQVKIRGHRIELSEIETGLLSFSKIKEAVVGVINEETEGILIAFYTEKNDTVNKNDLNKHLSQLLPKYMIPNDYILLNEIPITTNGKTDWKKLKSVELISEEVYIAPVSKIEQTIAEVWCQVLEKDKIGIRDNFFTIGGDSIKSIQICSRLYAQGYDVSVKDIFDNQSIEQLALKMKTLKIHSSQMNVMGVVPLSPIQFWFFNTSGQALNHFNQSVLLQFTKKITEEEVRSIFEKLVNHHDALRAIFKKEKNEYRQIYVAPEAYMLDLVSHTFVNEKEFEVEFYSIANTLQQSIDIHRGPLLKLALFITPSSTKLLLISHHLIIDGVSWRILFEDIDSLVTQLNNERSLELPFKTDSYSLWTESLANYSDTEGYAKIREYWTAIEATNYSKLPVDKELPQNLYKDNTKQSFALTEAETTSFSTDTNAKFNASTLELLIAGLSMTLNEKWNMDTFKIDLEGHGRVHETCNLNRTVGWFTSIYPVIITHHKELHTTIISTKEQLRSVPNQGNDYLLTRQNSKERDGITYTSEISFNYLGQFSNTLGDNNFKVITDYTGNDVDGQKESLYKLNIAAIIKDNRLEVSIEYNKKEYNNKTIKEILSIYETTLKQFISEAGKTFKTLLTPSDLTYKKLPFDKIVALQELYDISDVYPMSPMQQGIYFHSNFEEKDIYFQQMTLHVEGTLDIHILKETMNIIIKKYDILRTSFVHKDLEFPLQIVRKENFIEFSYNDISDKIESFSLQESIKTHELLDRDKPFNLQKDVLMRLKVIKTGDNQFALILSHHHILMDGWCVSLIFKDLKEIYQAIKTKSLAQINFEAPSYASFIKWLGNRDFLKSKDYWTAYLEGYEESTSLPSEITKTEVTKLASEHVFEELVIDSERLQKLKVVAQTCKVTISSILKVVWGLLLAKHNNRDEVVFGCVNSGRPKEIDNVEQIVGLFINTIPLRIAIRPDESFKQLFLRIQNDYIAAESYQYYPLYEIQKLTHLGSDLFKTIFVLENYPVYETMSEVSEAFETDFNITGLSSHYLTNYDVSFVIVPGDVLRIRLEYNNHLYNENQVKNIMHQIDAILDAVIENVNIQIKDLEIVSKVELDMYQQINATTTKDDFEFDTVLDRFKAQVARYPENIAIRHNKEQFSYRDIDHKSNLIAEYMLSNGVKPGQVVGLLLPLSSNVVTGILAILKIGCTYLPIDLTYPEERTTYMLKNSSCNFLLTNKTETFYTEEKINKFFIEDAIETHLPSTLLDKIIPDTSTPAYIMYSSEATGKSQGVVISHKSLYNYIDWAAKEYVNDNEKTFGLFTSIALDSNITTIFTPLVTGSNMVIYSDTNPLVNLKNIIKDDMVTTLKVTPSDLKILANIDTSKTEKGGSKIEQFIVGGEALNTQMVDSIKKKFDNVLIYNEYGHTETTGGCMIHVFNNEDNALTVPIGKPIQNMQIYLLDDTLNYIPVGATGEIYISGTGIANGYINQCETTKDRFIENPYKKGSTLYKTGDIARLLSSGVFEYIDRADSQVKINGYRIDVSEIERNLIQHPDIDELIVVVEEKDNPKHLIAYYKSKSEIAVGSMKKFLANRIPVYMFPTYYMRLEVFPSIVNGEIDKNELPDLDDVLVFEEPVTKIELALASIWSDVLKIKKEEIGITDSFFDLGGHSLKAMLLITKMNKEFDINILLDELYNNQTIKELSVYIENMVEIQHSDSFNEAHEDMLDIDI